MRLFGTKIIIVFADKMPFSLNDRSKPQRKKCRKIYTTRLEILSAYLLRSINRF